MYEFPAKQMITLCRRILGVALVGVLGILIPGVSAAATSGNRSGADIAVELDAVGSIVWIGARYDVTITNNGPQAVTSATVVVQLDPRANLGSGAPSCLYNSTADTLTCTFGPLAAGATTTLSATAYFGMPSGHFDTVDATATRTASAPADPNPANDSATTTCRYVEYPGGQFDRWRLFC